METIMDYLKRRLREVGPALWEPIADQAGVAKSLPRKIAYGDREDPKVGTVQPLLDYLQAVERGERALPAPGHSAHAGAAPKWDGVERRKAA